MTWLIHKRVSTSDLVVLDRAEREAALQLAHSHTQIMVDLYYETCEHGNRITEVLSEEGEVIGYEMMTPTQTSIRYYIDEDNPNEVKELVH